MESAAVVGGNLRLARLFHGLTLEDIASSIDRTRQFVHRLEIEQATPSAAILQLIAARTRVLPDFFSRAVAAPITEDQCHFRKHLSARVSIKHVALAKGEMFHRIVAYLGSQLELPANVIPQRDVQSFSDIELAAEACRRAWGLGLGPIENMVRVAENVGAIVTRFRGVGREIDAHSISAARPIIVLNAEERSVCRLRFDVAHELGHLVMHVGRLTGDRKTESEANRFAGAFLLPRSSFAKEFPRLRGQHLNWRGLADMKLRWKVSKAALLFRARQLGLIEESQYKTGVIRLARGGEARQEHEDRLVTPEPPELFAQAIGLIVEYHGVSLEAIARAIGLGPEILQEFLDSRTAAPIVERRSADVISLALRRQSRVQRPVAGE